MGIELLDDLEVNIQLKSQTTSLDKLHVHMQALSIVAYHPDQDL